MIEITSILDVEKYIDDIDVVIFDLDDTLYSEKDYVKSGFIAIANEYPQIENMYKRLWSAFLEGKQAIDFVLSQEDQLCEKDNCLKIYHSHSPKIKTYDGVKEMLQRIRANKKVGLITDGRPEGQNAKIDSLGLRLLFDKIIITDELGGVGFRKPNPVVFELMHNFFNVDYQRICYVGDNQTKDSVAPNGLGMKFIHFCNKDGLYE